MVENYEAEELGDSQEGQGTTPEEQEASALVDQGEEEQAIEEEQEEEEQAELTLRDIAERVQANADGLHKLSSTVGRVKKSLLPGQQQQQPQQRSNVIPMQQHQQTLQQPALPNPQLSGALSEVLGEEAAQAVLSAIRTNQSSLVEQALAPYSGALSQVEQAFNISEAANFNLQQLEAIFGNQVTTQEVAKLMRDDDVVEKEVKMFEQNPGFLPINAVAPYYQAAIAAKGRTPDKTAQILNNVGKKSKVKIGKKTGKASVSALQQLEGKSEEEISILVSRNPTLRKQVLKESGL
jgi:hypothetical protein